MIDFDIDFIMCSRKNFTCIKTLLTTVAIFNFSLHLTNIVMHIYYYSLVTNSGIVLSVIGIVFVLYSMYNYLIINLNQQKLHQKISIWKIFCWIETIILFGSSFAEGILILLYSKFLYFEVSIWYLLALCIGAIVDISGHLLLLFLIPCCVSKMVETKKIPPYHPSAIEKRIDFPPVVEKKSETTIEDHKTMQKDKQGKCLTCFCFKVALTV